MIPKAEPHMEPAGNRHAIPATLDQPSAPRFWVSVVGIGILTGLSAGLLTKLLEWVQRALWGGNGREILDAAQHTAAPRIFLILLAAGGVTGIAQVVLRKLSSGRTRRDGSDLVSRRKASFASHSRERHVVRRAGWYGCFTGSRRRTETSRRGVWQFFLRHDAVVR